MRTDHQNSVECIAAKGFHNFARCRLIQVFITEPPGTFAGAAFFITEDGEIHTGAMQNPGNSNGNFSAPVIV